jgi:hypothetical protein
MRVPKKIIPSATWEWCKAILEKAPGFLPGLFLLHLWRYGVGRFSFFNQLHRLMSTFYEYNTMILFFSFLRYSLALAVKLEAYCALGIVNGTWCLCLHE